jgi:thiol-disulfide isomerase/thioredoxin
MKLQSLVIGAALAAVTAIPAFAAKLGDPAAPLKINEWVKGKEVDVTDGKAIYVVEFWATWCGPCKASIPHLTELQKKFKDKGVVFIGISDETADKVKPFVEKMAEKMDYTVALDDTRKTSAGYMAAYGQGGIPTAFVVGKDKNVLWFGHPMGELEETLNKVVAGTYDLKAAAKKDEARARLDEYQKLASKGDAKAKELGQQILTDAGNDSQSLCDFALGIAANARNKNRDFALADTALDKAAKVAGDKNPQVLGVRGIVRFESGKEEDGLALAKQAVELAPTEKEKATYQNYVRVMETRLKAKAAASQGSAKNENK